MPISKKAKTGMGGNNPPQAMETEVPLSLVERYAVEQGDISLIEAREKLGIALDGSEDHTIVDDGETIAPPPQEDAVRETPPGTNTIYGINGAAKEQLIQIAQKVIGIREQKKDLSEAEKAEFAKAKAAGFDAAALKAALAWMKTDRQEREEAEALRDLYIETLREQV